MNVKNSGKKNNHVNELLKNFCLRRKPCEIEHSALKWSMQTGLSSIAYDYAINPTTDSGLINQLTASNLTSRFWFKTQLDSTKKIISVLNEQGVVPTLLKGISISTGYYPKPFYRMMRDIDILVDEVDIEKVEKLLQELDYEQRSTYSTEFYNSLHHTMPWQHRKNEIWVEVHKRLFPETSPCYSSPVFQFEVIKQEKVVDSFYGLKVYRLSKEFQLVYIATHWAERFKQTGGVFALLDAALIINKHDDEIDWGKITSWSNSPYVSNYVYLLFQYLRRSGFLKSSEKIDRHINGLQHSLGVVCVKILNSIIDKHIIAGKSFGRVFTVNNIEIIWLHLLEPSRGYMKILLLPVAIMFPKASKDRFNLKFQFSRLRTLLNFKKK